MKKTWKYILAVSGITILLIGLLVWDLHRRAATSIEAHDRRLRNDIADHRARLRDGDQGAPPFELGHAGQQALDHQWIWTRLSLAGYVERVTSIDQAVANLAATLQTFREGGFRAHERRTSFEVSSVQILLERVTQSGLQATDLKRLQRTLDELLATRVPVEEFVKGEHLLDRAEVLRVIPTRSDPHMMILAPPGWKEAFSWKVLIAKSLNQLDDDFRGFQPPPADDRFSERNSSYGALELRNVLTRSHLTRDGRSVFSSDRYALTHWHAVRLAIAILRFETESGRELKELEELVPQILPEIPKAPHGGQPYIYRDGWIRSENLWNRWRIRKE